MSKKCLIIKTQENTRHEQSVSLSTKEIFLKRVQYELAGIVRESFAKEGSDMRHK